MQMIDEEVGQTEANCEDSNCIVSIIHIGEYFLGGGDPLGDLAICFGNEESLVKPIHVLNVFHDAVEQLFIFPPLL